jgi:hypothetical protein
MREGGVALSAQTLNVAFTELELDAIGDVIMDRMHAYEEFAKEQPGELARIRPFAELYAAIARKIYEAKREAGLLEDEVDDQ